jgi:hypothetical protein
MPDDKLTSLQKQLLRALAGLDPAWTLTGGAALALVHTRHRGTRDLDLFWRGRNQLGEVTGLVRDRIAGEGLAMETLQTAPAFVRLRVSDGCEVVVVDLVADPTPSVEDPVEFDWEGVRIRVDSARELVANKLCALLSRSELRDLVDLRALLDAGRDLRQGLADAPRKDSGSSPLVLAWVLHELPLRALASAEGWPAARVEDLVEFRDRLVATLTEEARPEG